MVERSKLDEDTQGKAVDPTHYRGMIDTLMYLTVSRPTFTFVCMQCARYQTKHTEKAPPCSLSDTDHAGRQDTRRSTSGCMQLLGDRLVSWSSKRQKSAIPLHQRASGEWCGRALLCQHRVSTSGHLYKSLCREIIEFLINKLGMRSFTPETLKLLADEAEE
ncbi:hypothetical protein Tco_1054980 [Tanacetum coccineum]|uniref:Uncharacterized protein n=1 Tax=Tanacetum coccineum TaxID=301880 RepID=A0ABQ5GYC5_9ASTR